MKLEGKVALVTGASRGIGRAIALTLAKEGADVGVNFLEKRVLASKVVNEIKKMGRRAITIQADVRNFEEVTNMFEVVFKEFNKVDILVNNAGIVRDRTLLNMTKEEWDNVINTDLTGVFNCTKLAIPDMVQRGNGRIINISSVVGQMGNFGQANYAAAKAGVIGFTKSVAKELARKGITVNAIAPGFIETDMLKDIPKKVKASVLEKIPLGRFGKPEEVAELVVFLASDKTGFITGQVFNINGGLY